MFQHPCSLYLSLAQCTKLSFYVRGLHFIYTAAHRGRWCHHAKYRWQQLCNVCHTALPTLRSTQTLWSIQAEGQMQHGAPSWSIQSVGQVQHSAPPTLQLIQSAGQVCQTRQQDKYGLHGCPRMQDNYDTVPLPPYSPSRLQQKYDTALLHSWSKLQDI